MNGEKFRCLKCGTAMKTRVGQYGLFYYCSNGNHGTISVDKYNNIMRQFPKNEDLPIGRNDSFMFGIERQTMALGGVMSDTERFYIDNEAYYENSDDFWQNQRPY